MAVYRIGAALKKEANLSEDQPLDLVGRLRRHDRAALAEAYRQFNDSVLAAAASVLGNCGDREIARDILHDVFVSLARISGTLPAEVNLRAYLVRAAVNRARDHLRRIGQVKFVPEGMNDLSSSGPGLLEMLEKDEEVAELMVALGRLPQEQRIVVSLRIWGGMSLGAIGLAEGISDNTAQSRWRYAIEKLQRSLTGVKP
jgi:RNA polymerase sigma-70 factor (ECF subfamily)